MKIIRLRTAPSSQGSYTPLRTWRGKLRGSTTMLWCCLLLFTALLGGQASLNAQYATIDYASFNQGSRGSVADIAYDVAGNIFVYGTTRDPGFLTTDGTSASGPSTDLYLQKYDANYNLVFSTVIDGNSFDDIKKLFVSNGSVYLVGRTFSSDLPVTTGAAYSGQGDLFWFKLDANTGAIIAGQYIGGSENDATDLYVVEENENIYLLSASNSIDYPVTDGSSKIGLAANAVITKISPTGAIDYSKYLGAWTFDFAFGDLAVESGIVSLAIMIPDGLPYWQVTDGSSAVEGVVTIATQLDASGNVVYANQVMGIPGFGLDELAPPFVAMSNGNFFIKQVDFEAVTPSTDGSAPSNNSSGTAYIKLLPTGDVDYLLYKPQFPSDTPIFAINDCLYDVSLGNSSTPTTDGSTFQGSDDIYLQKLSPTGGLAIGTLLGGGNLDRPFAFKVLPNGEIYIAGTTNSPNFPVIDGSTLTDASSRFFVKLDQTGSIQTSTIRQVGVSDMEVFGTKVALIGPVRADIFDVFTTDNSMPIPSLFNAELLTVLDLCPASIAPANDALQPALQEVCQNGVVGQIRGERIEIPSDQQAQLFNNGQASSQPPIPASSYQWQVATSSTGPWMDIPGAVTRNYTPQPIVTTRFFRRNALSGQCCGSTVISTSEVVEVRVNSFVAPMVDAGGVYNTCPGTNVTLDATIASGGTAPFTYEWDMGAGTGANPTVAPTQSTVFTVTVTDANACQQIDQAIVNTYAADAGPATASACAGQAVLIGGDPVPGVPGVVYAWSPADGLSCTDCPNPLANPASQTVYTLTLTVPVTGGTTCETTDMITVTPVQAPRADFGGPNLTVCLGQLARLGTPAESGFTYTWAPGIYLGDNQVAQPLFRPGNIALPTPNPFNYFVTARKEGCTFVDEVEEVTVIEARAGVDGCGPRTVGEVDRTPNIDETYEWVKISGPGTITGPTNTPQTSVSASVGGNTVYELRVTLNGTTCTDQVVVPADCECNVFVTVDAPFACPDFDLNPGNNVVLTATGSSSPSIPESSYIFTWEVISGMPGGLDVFSGPEVRLTDGEPRTYRVTLTSSVNPDFGCSFDIEVNNPAWSLPVFSAADASACALDPVAIGEPSVAGYTYEWTLSGGGSAAALLSDVTVSMPTATVPETTTFLATVTDTGSGCVVTDEVTVNSLTVVAQAGPDVVICDNSTITLGAAAAYPNATVMWEPAGASYQNGTGPTDAQPEVLVAVDQMFTLTVTSDVGNCVSMDEAMVTVGDPVTPFTLDDVVYCPGDGAVALGADVPTGLASYTWSPSSLLDNASVPMPNTNNPPPSAETVFTLLVTNTDGCEFLVTQTIRPSIDQIDAGSSQALCLGETTTIGSASNPTGAGITYTWSGTGTAGISDINSPNPSFDSELVGAGSYTLTLTVDNNGCGTTDEVTITVNEYQLPAIAPVTICQGTSTQIGTTPELGVRYFWTPETGLSNPNIANPTVSGLTMTTNYTLTAIGLNGCTDVATVSVVVSPTPAPTVSIPTLEACTVDENVMFDLTATPMGGTYTYRWSPDDGSLSNLNVEDPQVVILVEGTREYTVQVTDENGCSTEAMAQLVVENCVNDLATTIVLVPNSDTGGTTTADDNDGNYDIGETAVFTFNVFNQGATPASDITITNYVPTELDVVTADGVGTVTNVVILDSNGTPRTVTVTITKTGDTYELDFGNDPADWLQPGEQISFDVTYMVNAGAVTGDPIINTIEISNFDNDNNNSNTPPVDVDSTPDAMDGNTTGENPRTDGNDNFTDNANGDEDDHDFAEITAEFILPVELLNFNAKANVDHIDLSWATASETNNSHFDLERSEDAKVFKPIARIEGQGTTLETTQYAFEDKDVVGGVIYYYRLKQVDIDGTFEYSQIETAMLSGNTKEGIDISPNPISGGAALQVRLWTSEPDVELFIMDAYGRVVSQVKRQVQQSGWVTTNVDVSRLAAGTYIVMDSSGNIKRFVKLNE